MTNPRTLSLKTNRRKVTKKKKFNCRDFELTFSQVKVWRKHFYNLKLY